MIILFLHNRILRIIVKQVLSLKMLKKFCKESKGVAGCRLKVAGFESRIGGWAVMLIPIAIGTKYYAWVNWLVKRALLLNLLKIWYCVWTAYGNGELMVFSINAHKNPNPWGSDFYLLSFKIQQHCRLLCKKFSCQPATFNLQPSTSWGEGVPTLQRAFQSKIVHIIKNRSRDFAGFHGISRTIHGVSRVPANSRDCICN
jgi:hypothetical protein